MVTILVAAACGKDTDTRAGPTASTGMRVASFDFAESELLAELYAQVIESTGVPVVTLGPVGPGGIRTFCETWTCWRSLGAEAGAVAGAAATHDCPASR